MNPLLNRRKFLGETASGLSGIALASLLQENDLLAKESGPIRPNVNPKEPFASRKSHHAPAAKNVLVIFCSGACSQLDTFDYKPELIKRHGQPMPGGANLRTFQSEQGNLTKSPWEFTPRGDCGKMISSLVPQLGDLADDMCFIHSLKGKTNTHGPGENFMSTGYIFDGFPSMGSWVTWALGSENSDLPAYVAIPDPRGTPQSSVNNWGPGFLPAAFQGTDFNATNPLRNLRLPAGVGAKTDLATRSFLRRINERHLERFPGDSELSARISSYELAAKMQLSVPEVSDLSKETGQTQTAYGVNDKQTSDMGRRCLLGRRLMERGVRFVQLYSGGPIAGSPRASWDAHESVKQNHGHEAGRIDRPVAALLRDLKERGMLKDTLVLFTTEFGRTPFAQSDANQVGPGRDHNRYGFSCWLAGAGVNGGTAVGSTDEVGWKAVERPIPWHDFHATLLHLFGIDHERLTFYHNGIQRRLTNVHGEVVEECLA